MTPTTRMAIIGGGYTGAALAIHLMRAASAPLALTIVEPSDQLGRGIAYAASDPDHRINVPSDRMSLFGDDPGHATRWFREHGVLPDEGSTDDQGHHYVPRFAYGTYVGAMLTKAIAAKRMDVRFEHLRVRATGVRACGPAWAVTTSDGRSMVADVVALCFGHAPPSVPCLA